MADEMVDGAATSTLSIAVGHTEALGAMNARQEHSGDIFTSSGLGFGVPYFRDLRDNIEDFTYIEREVGPSALSSAVF